jgi:hypothetical protein
MLHQEPAFAFVGKVSDLKVIIDKLHTLATPEEQVAYYEDLHQRVVAASNAIHRRTLQQAHRAPALPYAAMADEVRLEIESCTVGPVRQTVRPAYDDDSCIYGEGL